MNAKYIALTPPSKHTGNTAAPEVLAACLAKYSRSMSGIDEILDSIDHSNTEKAVDAIFKFVDYGHASIGGLTGGIPIAIDGISMLLALKLFEFGQMADGQESSTRYITLTKEGLPSAENLGIPLSLVGQWEEVCELGFSLYSKVYEDLNNNVTEEKARIPAGTSEKVAQRMLKNYALDRARYFLPLATKTNIALVATARIWAEIIRSIDSLQTEEAKELAIQLRDCLKIAAPNLIRHSYPNAASLQRTQDLNAEVSTAILLHGVPNRPIKDKLELEIEDTKSSFFKEQPYSEATAGKVNRYCQVGPRIKRQFVRVAWNNIAMAELRDLNRHRTGYRYTDYVPKGFYLPAEALQSILKLGLDGQLQRFLSAYSALISEFASKNTALVPYAFFLGTQVAFEHSTQADKFIYEVELRTGTGAHFRYAEHLSAAVAAYIKLVPEAARHINIGTAEPE